MDYKTRFNKLVAIGIVLLFVGVCGVWALTRTITDTGDTVDTFIRNSNGNYWTASFANLQLAIYDLNSTGGIVEIPATTITLTGTIYLINGLWLKGVGNSTCLILDNNVNRTMLRNYTSTKVNNVKISDMTLDGNGLNQPLYFVGGNPRAEKHIIDMRYCSNLQLFNLFINNSQSAAIYTSYCSNSSIHDCIVRNTGVNWFDQTTDNANVNGIQCENYNSSSIVDCTIDNVYASGIVIESLVGLTSYPSFSHDFIIKGCLVSNGYAGIWLERTTDGIIADCMVFNNTRLDSYAARTGYGVVISYSENITVNGVHAEKNGNPSGKNGSGFYVSGTGSAKGNHTFTGCVSQKNYGKGFDIEDKRCKTIGCSSLNDSGQGIYFYNNEPTITGCFIKNSGGHGIYLSSATRTLNKAGLIVGNTILDAGDNCIYNALYNITITGNALYKPLYYGVYLYSTRFCIVSDNTITSPGADGIQVSTNSQNITCNSNSIAGAIHSGIELTATSKNCTLTSNQIHLSAVGINEVAGADYNIIGFNNCLGCTTPIDSNGINTIVEYNFGTVS